MRCDLNGNTDSISSYNSHLTINRSAYHITTVQNKILALLTSFSLQQKVVDRDGAIARVGRALHRYRKG